MNIDELVLKNAHVWRGTHFEWQDSFHVSQGHITNHNPLVLDNANVIDLDGGYIIPGITDIHTHADFTAIDDRAKAFALGQGVTRQVAGLCGYHPVFAPHIEREDYVRFTGFLGREEMLTPSWDQHFATLHDTGPVKKYQLFGLNSFLYSYPLDDIEQVDAHVALCVKQYQAYAFSGLSLSLNYHPVKTMDTPLLQRFMHQLLSQLPVCCHYHVRDQKEGIFDSIEEVMVWHHGTQARCHISHLKFGGASHLGRFDACYQQLLAWRDQADFALSWDTYPFAFASSTITSFFPTTDFWQEQSEVEFCQWIADNPPHKLADVVIICDDPLFNQRTLSAISKTLNESLAKALLTICQHLNGAGTYQRQFCETADLNWLLAQPDVLIASDSFGLDQVHPRNHSTFTQVLYQAWCQGEAAFHEMVQRIQHGANLVFPDIPMPSLAIGEPAELFFFTPIKQEIPTDTSTAFAISGTLIGHCLYQTHGMHKDECLHSNEV